MYNNPTYQQPGTPNLQTLLDALATKIFRDMNCVKVGTIMDFNAATQEASVQVAFQRVTSINPDGVKTLAEYPLLLNVPVYFPAGGGFTLTFPIAAGDECILLFNDRMIDGWLASGAGLPPADSRSHDLSDGIALVGLRNNTRSLSRLSTASAQLRSDDGQTYVEVAGGGIVNIVAPTSINLTSPMVNINASNSVNVTTPVETISGVFAVQNVAGSASPCTINGAINATGDIIAGSGTSNISALNHTHPVTTAPGETGAPVG